MSHYEKMGSRDLKTFGAELEMVIGRPTTLRPFVCEGSPLDCEVLIVGYNPATSIEGDWWKFWLDDYGYQKKEWLACYHAQREKLSKTRAKIEEITNALSGFHVLEANIDARSSAKKRDYPKPQTQAFDFLLAACQPNVVIAHGRDAVAHLQFWRPRGTLIECRHFIFVGRVRTAQIVSAAREALEVIRLSG